MSLLDNLRDRARVLLGKVPPAPPVAAQSAEPRASRLGPPVLRAVGPCPVAPPAPSAWDRDPESGATLPTGPLVTAGPTEWTAARIAHRHGWFAAGAFEAAKGTANRAEILRTLDGWLRQDIPGHGIAWAHPTDLAARLAHWAAGLSFLGNDLPDDLRQALAGSAAWHLDHLRVRLPRRPEEGLRRVTHHAGLVLGGFTFPDLEGAREAWSEGLAGLNEDLPGVMYTDGSPRDVAPLAYAEALWFVALARAVAAANGAGFPGAAAAAVSRGARFLERVAGPLGALPAIGDRPVDTVLAAPGYPLAWSLWNLSVGSGFDSAEMTARAADDPRLAWLGYAPGAEAPAPAGKNWSMHVWREGGVVLAETKIKNKPSRVVATFGPTGRGSPLTHAAPMALVWDVGDVVVLGDPGPSLDNPELAGWLASAAAHNVLLLDNRAPAPGTPAGLDLARVDTKKARMEAHHDGYAKVGIPLTHQRKVLLNQARCVVTDKILASGGRVGRHAVQLTWQLGPGWEVTQAENGWTAKNGALQLVIQLPANLTWRLVTGQPNPDPAGWMGTRAAPCLVGSGGIEGEAEFVSSFEVR